MSGFLDERPRGSTSRITREYTVVCTGVVFWVLANSGEHAYTRVSEFGVTPHAVFEGKLTNLITAYKTVRV